MKFVTRNEDEKNSRLGDWSGCVQQNYVSLSFCWQHLAADLSISRQLVCNFKVSAAFVLYEFKTYIKNFLYMCIVNCPKLDQCFCVGNSNILYKPRTHPGYIRRKWALSVTPHLNGEGICCGPCFCIACDTNVSHCMWYIVQYYPVLSDSTKKEVIPSMIICSSCN